MAPRECSRWLTDPARARPGICVVLSAPFLWRAVATLAALAGRRGGASAWRAASLAATPVMLVVPVLLLLPRRLRRWLLPTSPPRTAGATEEAPRAPRCSPQ